MRTTPLVPVVLGIPVIAVPAWAFALGSPAPLPDAIVPLSLLPLLVLAAFLGVRAWRPRGAPALRFDDRLGQGPLADLVRVVLRTHTDLITANLPGAVGSFTLTIIDRPARMLMRLPEGTRQLAVTYLHPFLPTGFIFLRANGLPMRPAVCIVRSSWDPYIQKNRVPRGLERHMIEVLYHELVHLYGYGHGPAHNHLTSRFAERVMESLARPGGPPGASAPREPAGPFRKH